MSSDPYRYFRLEAHELLEQLGHGLLELEHEPVAEELPPRLFRLAHTLKGAARVVKQTEIAELAHGLEEQLSLLRSAPRALGRDRIFEQLAIVDAIRAHMSKLGVNVTRSSSDRTGPDAAAAALPEEAFRGLRADAAEHDGLLDGLGEASAQIVSVERAIEAVEQARRLAELVKEHVNAPRGSAARLRALSEDLHADLSRTNRALRSGVDGARRELDQVRGLAQQLRLVPARAIFASLERVAHDAARELGKRIAFHTSGGEIRLDAEVLGKIHSALVQLVRNAVAHGIEAPARRASKNKPEVGSVRVDISRRASAVVFACSDDGAGVDLGAVERIAKERGLAARAGAGGQEILDLLLSGGFSTAQKVDQISGRGVGLDVVRDVVSQIGGTVGATTTAGAGTTVEISATAILSCIDALVVTEFGARAAIPLGAVLRVLGASRGQVLESAGSRCLPVGEAPLPFLELARYFGKPGSMERRTWPVVVVGSARGSCALAVESLLGPSELVVRPLPALAAIDPVISGAAIDSSGSMVAVLDPERLFAAARTAGDRAAEATHTRAPILVIDDSLTTRMLEQSILESAGYPVDVVGSAEEALERVRARKYGLFLVDVEMPGMDGFELVERMRKDPELSRIPSILVTSRESPEDRARGERAGARAYVAKSEFDQALLLSTIRELMVTP